MKTDKIKTYLPLLKGSIGENHFKCGKNNCACKQGALHSAFYYCYRYDGKSHTIHIPKDIAAEVIKLCDNWKKLNKNIEIESQKIIKSLIKDHKQKKKTS